MEDSKRTAVLGRSLDRAANTQQLVLFVYNTACVLHALIKTAKLPTTFQHSVTYRAHYIYDAFMRFST